MFLIDDSSIGPVIVFCAYKTGCTSLTEIAKHHGVTHEEPEFWHTVDTSKIGNRNVVITVRDPRERLLSLWGHWRVSSQSKASLQEFLNLRICLDDFFRVTLTSSYMCLLGRDLTHIRMETFHEDLERLFGWTHRVHLNKTKHPSVEELCGVIDTDIKWWWPDAVNFGYE